MERVSVLCLLLLLCSLSGAELQDNEIIEQRKASPESVNVPEQPQPCLSDLYTVLTDMSAKLAVLESKMETLNQLQVKVDQLQILNQEQAAKLKDVDALKLQLHEQAAKLKELEKQTSEVDALKSQQQEQVARLRELQTSEVDPIKEQLRGHAAELNSMKAWNNVTESHVDSLRRDRTVRQVAFSAALLASSGGHIGPINAPYTLVFRYVVSNIGNAYNQNTGFFTAPVRGAYHFEFHIGSWSDEFSKSSAVLEKNGARVFSALQRVYRGHGASSNGATLLLSAGDVVSVRLRQNYVIHDDQNHLSTFSGFLVFPM